MKSVTHGIFRPHSLPSQGIPLAARSVGSYRVFPGWKDAAFRKSFVQVFWGVKGKGEIIVNEVPYQLKAETAIVYMPGMEHQIKALDEEWNYRWWTMDGEKSYEVLETFGLKAGFYEAGPAPIKLFEELEQTISNPTRKSELEASALAYQLTCQLMSGINQKREQGSPVTVNKAVVLCRRYWSLPEFNVEFLAAKMKIHRTTLSRIFSTHTGMTLSKYITQMRVQNAESLLLETDQAVNEIARQCGFDDSNYFSRVFAKYYDLSPRKYRMRRL